MEKGLKPGYTNEQFSDKPAPGRGFLLLFNIVIIGSILPFLFRIFDDGLNDPETITALALAAPVIALIYWLTKKSVHGTSYKISDNTLEIRGGMKYKKIRIGQILEISHARSWKEITTPILRREGFCNRFTDLVRLDIKGDTVFLSPSDPEQFIAILRELKDASAGNSTTTPEDSR